MVNCPERTADCLHMVRAMSLLFENPVVFCVVEIRNGFTFLVRAGY